MVKIISALIAGTLIGVAVAKVTTQSPKKEQLPASVALDQAEHLPGDPDDALDPRYVRMLDAMAAVLDQEVAERRRLEEKIDQLTKKLEANVTLSPVTPAVKRQRNRLQQQNTLLSRLRDTGLEESDALDIKARVDKISMARLEIQDRAKREDWERQQVRDAMVELNDLRTNLRTDLGEEKYDAYLFASGQSNRVSVVDVMTGSPAERAGMKPGDIILSYGGERLYSQRDLRATSSSGQAGESVPVDILRGGEQTQVYLPRGPLGVQLGAQTVNPDGG